MRILFVAWRDLPHPRAGGSEIVVDALAEGLRARGHEVTLMAGRPVGSHSYAVLANGGTYSQYLTAPARYLARFRAVDLVVDVVNGMPFFSPLWRRKPRLALVTHVHSDQWARYFPRPISDAARIVESSGLRIGYRNTRFLAISESTAAELEAIGVKRSQLSLMWLGATVDDSVAAVARAEEPTFVALGRLAPNKRLDLLLRLWSRVAPVTGGKLVIVGDGPERASLEQLARGELGLHNVVFEGRVSEVRKSELLREAWLLVHTAEREGWGLVIPEAGLCRTPALCFDVPGVKDAVENEVSGVLVSDEDEFVRQWIALTGDSERRARLGAGAAARAVELTWERSIDDFLVAARAAVGDR